MIYLFFMKFIKKKNYVQTLSVKAFNAIEIILERFRITLQILYVQNIVKHNSHNLGQDYSWQ